MGSRGRYDYGQKVGDDGILHDDISAINIRVYSAEELKSLSTCNVVNPKSFDYVHNPIPSKNITFDFWLLLYKHFTVSKIF